MAQNRGGTQERCSSRQPSIGLDFFLLWIGQTVSMLGDHFGSMALSILILQRTGSATAMSLNVILSMVPTLLVGPAAGLVVDRVDRKRVLVSADMGRGVLTLGLGWLIYAGNFTILGAYIWAVLVSLFRVFYDPGTLALIPALVPPDQLQRANALQASGRNAAMVLGPALAGLAIARLGPWFALAADAATFGISAMCISFARARFEERHVKTGRPKMSELREGFEFFRSVRLAPVLLALTVIVNACGQPSGIALNFHVLKTLRGTATFLGVIGSVSAGASLLSSFVVATRKRWPHLGRMIVIAIGGMGLSFALASAAPTLGLLPVFFAIGGAAGPLLQTSINTLYQDITPPDLRGRVFALRTALSQVLSPFSFALAGVLLDVFGSRIVFGGLGVILLTTAALASMRRELKDL